MKLQNIITKFTYIFLLIFMLISIALLFLFPANRLIASSMIILGILSFIIFLISAYTWNKIYPKLLKIEPYLYYIGLFILGVALFIISYSRSSLHTNTLTDYIVLYHSAGEYANGNELDPSSYYSSYFSWYNNNIKPMLLLSWLFSLADLFRISRFNFVLFLVCVQIILSVWSIGYLITTKENKTWRVPSLLLFSLLLPMYGMTAAFYTDTMSMGLPIIAMSLIKLAYECFESPNLKLKRTISPILSIVAAMCIVLSFIWKITAIIPIIGYVIAFLLYKRKIPFKFISCLVIPTIVVYGLSFLVFNSYNITTTSKENSDPLISWIAIGLTGDGSFGSGREFVSHLHSLEGSSSKYSYTIEFIKNNKSNFYDIEHLVAKFQKNFADGTLCAGTYTPLNDDGSIFWDLFNPYGKHYWRICQITFCYLAMIYLSLLLGTILNVVRLFQNKKVDVLLFSTHLSFFGIFIFLMLWEANSRQLYNQMPTLILGAMLCVKYLFPSRNLEKY